MSLSLLSLKRTLRGYESSLLRKVLLKWFIVFVETITQVEYPSILEKRTVPVRFDYTVHRFLRKIIPLFNSFRSLLSISSCSGRIGEQLFWARNSNTLPVLIVRSQLEPSEIATGLYNTVPVPYCTVQYRTSTTRTVMYRYCAWHAGVENIFRLHRRWDSTTRSKQLFEVHFEEEKHAKKERTCQERKKKLGYFELKIERKVFWKLFDELGKILASSFIFTCQIY